MKPGTLTPSTSKYITAEEALNYLGMASGVKLTKSVIESFIEGATGEINDEYGSYFCSTTCTNEYYDAPGRDDVLVLMHYPIISVESMYYKLSTSEDCDNLMTESSTFVSHGYWVMDNDAALVRLWTPIRVSGMPRYGVNNTAYEDVYKVSYTFGYSDVPEWVKELCKKMVAVKILRFRQTDGSSASCIDLHRSLRDQISSLKKEIDKTLLRVRSLGITSTVI